MHISSRSHGTAGDPLTSPSAGSSPRPRRRPISSLSAARCIVRVFPSIRVFRARSGCPETLVQQSHCIGGRSQAATRRVAAGDYPRDRVHDLGRIASTSEASSTWSSFSMRASARLPATSGSGLATAKARRRRTMACVSSSRPGSSAFGNATASVQRSTRHAVRGPCDRNTPKDRTVRAHCCGARPASCLPTGRRPWALRRAVRRSIRR